MQKRKRVALFANGWAKECLQEIGNGIYKRAQEADVDILAFVDYSLHVSPTEEQEGEFNIFRLPDLKDFDGVLLLSNSFNLQKESEYLCQMIKEASVPAISLEYELDGIDYFGSDNYSGMYELADHMIKEHGAQKIVFIAGIRGHADSEIRLKAVTDAARDNGIRIKEENILYGNWSEGEACMLLENWIKLNQELPDTIMCANDIMALGVCQWLQQHGHRVPKDVKVTGYDCIGQGQVNTPVLTTVSREWANMGSCAMQFLIDKMEGKETPAREMMKASPVYGESCGCDMEKKEIGDEAQLRSAIAALKFDSMSSDQHFRHMYMSVRKVETIEELHGSLSYFVQHSGWMEGENFMMCLHPGFFATDASDDLYKAPGYSEEVDVVCSLKDGTPEECQRLPLKEAVFRAADRSGKAGLYIFVPVRIDDKNMGFAVITRGFDIVNDFMLYIWTRHVNQYVEQVLSNVKIASLTRKLRELSVTDALTGLYNRMGCERVLYPFMEECQRKGGRGVVMLADIDRMKTINDKFGHGQGDTALKTVADVLKTAMPKGYMAGRFGGDEFFVVGESDEEVSIEEISEHVSKKLAEEVKRRKLIFPLTISIGGTQLKQGDKFVLNDCLQKADEFMYRVKKKHHREIDGD